MSPKAGDTTTGRSLARILPSRSAVDRRGLRPHAAVGGLQHRPGTGRVPAARGPPPRRSRSDKRGDRRTAVDQHLPLDRADLRARAQKCPSGDMRMRISSPTTFWDVEVERARHLLDIGIEPRAVAHHRHQHHPERAPDRQRRQHRARTARAARSAPPPTARRPTRRGAGCGRDPASIRLCRIASRPAGSKGARPPSAVIASAIAQRRRRGRPASLSPCEDRHRAGASSLPARQHLVNPSRA